MEPNLAMHISANHKYAEPYISFDSPLGFLQSNSLFVVTTLCCWSGSVWDTITHAEVSLSKILNPTAISKGPAMSWRLIQGVPWPTPIESLDLAPVTPAPP